ncbi:MAG: NFACT family protein [Clostridia bacterium]|nr:NFACT family protein [Clostridia bacterium]
MPFDGIVTKCIVEELSETLSGGRVEKIFQPEVDEIILNIRAKGQNLKLILSAGANYPRIHLTDSVKENPSTPPVFCMLLRKHLGGGKILGVEFHDFERIVTVLVESTNELGDISTKRLIIEIMGRHSNIVLVNQEGKIIDSIKHVDNEVSSVREVMPARDYILPPAQNKTSPNELDIDRLIDEANCAENITIENYLLNNIKGFSPLLCREICHNADVDGKRAITSIDSDGAAKLKQSLKDTVSKIRNNNFTPCIIFDNQNGGKPVDFHCLETKQYRDVTFMQSMSEVLDVFYSTKDKIERLKQKKSDVMKVLKNSLDRCNKKLALQQEKLRDVADREKIKLYGELITANIYCIPKNVKSVSLLNYYSESGDYIDISLDENRSPQENAQRYFRQYSKAKSAYEFTSKQVEETLKELEYLESVNHLLDNCSSLLEIDEIRQELAEEGYLHSKRKATVKKKEKAMEPLRFKSSDGFDILVGKNNKQNDLLTLKTASSNDVWLHTRNIPGSHVIIRKTQQNIPDNTLLEAAILAAYHSKSKNSSTVPVDYTAVKNVKKPSGAKPGMVIYENFKTLIVTPNEELVNKLKAGK